MKQRILNHTSFLVVMTVLLTFVASSLVMYQKFSVYMKQGIRDEAEYIRVGVEEFGEAYLNKKVGDATSSRITLTDSEGNVLFDSEADAAQLPNHSNRPEFVQAMKDGFGEKVRYSETLSRQTFYYAVKLENGDILRVAKTTDSVFLTLMSSFTLLGLLMIVILLVEFTLVQKQTKKLIQPVNELDLEHPLDNVCYEELRPLLMRVDQQNRQIAAQVEELKKAEAVRREFSANVSHELKTPLTSISGYAELMENGIIQAKEVPHYAHEIRSSATRLITLINDIIQLSQLDSPVLEVIFEQVNVYAVAQKVVQALQINAAERQVTLTLTGSDAVICGNRSMIEELITNLCDNALRYNYKGGTVRVSVVPLKGRVILTVQDTGIGISQEDQARVFERFYRVDKSRSKETGGTGLGLSIVKHIVAKHDADIKLESELGRGTSVRVTFYTAEH